MEKKGRKPQDPVLKQALITYRFNLVKELMEHGCPKYIACKKLGIDRNWLHKNTTAQQKRILDEIYFSFSKGSYSTKWRMENS